MKTNNSIRSSQKGFAPVFLIIGVLVVAAIIGGVVVMSNKDKTTTTGTNSATDKNAYGTPTGGSGTKSPANVPKNLPQYPGAKVTESTVSAEGSTLTMESSDSLEKIMAYYRQELPKMGWKIDVNVGDNDIQNLLVFRDDTLEGELGVAATFNDKLSIMIGTHIPYEQLLQQ